MKRNLILVIFAGIMSLLFSCHNNGQKKENAEETPTIHVFYTYDYIWSVSNGGHTKVVSNKDFDEHDKYVSFEGLAVKRSYLYSYNDDPLGIGGYHNFLTILHPTDSPGMDANNYHEDYIMFDDEANYDSDIFEWRLAYFIAEDLFKWNTPTLEFDKYTDMRKKGRYHEYRYSSDLLDLFLMEVSFLPYNVSDYIGEEVLEIFKKNYYNLKDKPIYQASSGYGFRKYPIGYSVYFGNEYLRLSRAKNIEGIPDGTLIITQPSLLSSYLSSF